MNRVLFIVVCTSGSSVFSQNIWSPVGTGMDNTVKVIARENTSNMLYVGGAFQNAGGSSANFIVKCDGNSYTAMGAGTNGDVNAIAIKGTKVYVGGDFTAAGGSGANYVAVWDTVALTWATLGTGMDAPIYSLAYYNNELYAGGAFVTAGGGPASHIAKWNGAAWVDVGGGMDGDVNALSVYNNELYAGGWFLNAGGVQTNFIARWNGSVWDSVDVGMDFYISSFYVFNSELYVGGGFSMAGGVPVMSVAKWNSSTTAWSGLGSGTDLDVSSFTDRTGTLYAGGQFTIAGGNPANYVAKWSGSQWDSVDTGMDGYVNTLQKHKGAVFAGGQFNNASGKPARFIAKWCDVDAQISAGATAICIGDTISLNASGGNTYSWFSGETTGSISVYPTVTTTYTVVAYRFYCSDTAKITITVNPLPVISISGNDTTCFGTATFLTASGGVSYSWNVGGTTSTIGVNPGSTYTFIVVGTDANGCTNSDSIQVVVNPLPSVTAAPDTIICLNGTAMLTATGGGTYSWSSGQTDAAISVSPTVTTDFIVTVTDANNCSNKDTATVTLSIPVASITGSTAICSGDSAMLMASGGGTYLWDFGSTDAMVYVSPTSNSSYTVTVTDANTCTDTDTININVLSAITAMISATDTTICNGENPTLTASGGTTFIWNTGATTAAISVTPSTNTTYTAIVSSATCSDTAQFTLMVNANPTVTITGVLSICEGDNSTLTATNSATGVSYLWNTSATTASIFIAPTTNTNYSVTISDANGCSGSASAAVIVNSLPVVSINGNTTICTGDNSTLTASGGTSYLWNTGATTSIIIVSPTSSTGYTVTVSNANNCSSVDSTTITVNQLPVITTSGNSTLCAGDSVVITASGGATYLWSTGATTSAIVVYPTITSSYTVTASSGSCSSSALVTVTVNNGPSVTLTAVDATCSTCCDGSATATPTGTSPFSYLWSPSGQTTQTATGLCVGTYTVCVNDANGCQTCDTITINYTIGVSDISSFENIYAYPNPFSDMTTIYFSKIVSYADIKVVDMLGKQVQNIAVMNSDKAVINKNNLQTGIYFMQIISEGNLIGTGKLIVE